MRLSALFASLAVAILTAASAHAQDAAATEGRYSAALSRMLTETAAGTCPEDVMGPSLLAACQQQIAAMAPALQSLGAIETVTFVRAEEAPQYGRVEVYTVRFAGGQSMTWIIGGLTDGKYDVAFSNG